ncbi:MAG: AAA family ATPase [Lachnospiraceae bacterium]|nr:AAA family ATPase [Lachnospiraceae bacterium]
MNDFMDSMGGKKANYTLDEIDEAKKRQKKNGGTFMENLEAVRIEKGGKVPSSAGMTSAAVNCTLSAVEAMSADLQAMAARSEAANSAVDDVQGVLKNSTDDINKALKELNTNVESDFGVATSAAAISVTADNPEVLKEFDGLTDEIKKSVFGQDEFIRKLIIAFKRPFVSERDHNDALNSIFITGPECSGKHYTLGLTVAELNKRRIISGDAPYTIDLSLYPSAAEEKLFLQDLYSALQNKASVIVFENMENCHISMLTRISDLVTTGECRLSERYVMSNGQLVSVSNALAGETVGSFEAKGKYLVFMGRMPLDKLAGIMGAPFVNALGDVCTAQALDTEAIDKINSVLKDQLAARCKKQLAYDIETDESFDAYMASQTSRNRGLKGILDTYDETIRALSEMRLERDDLSGKKLTLKCRDGLPYLKVDEDEIKISDYLPTGYNGEEEAVERELDNIVGLDMVKDYIRSLKEYYAMQKRRREEGLKAGELNKHMIFTGNPGTGKTTIARIVSKYLKAIGVLSGGQLVEVSRGDLVGRFVGHTAPLVNQVVKSALGGVLFIDEAYSLYRGEDDSFGLEAIDTLVKCIEDNRDNLIVILAGYSKEMEDFLESNSGLKSRFPNIIDFPDYTADELAAIAKITAKSKGYEIDEGVFEPMTAFFAHVQATNAREAGNGRLVRNKVEEAILNQSKRLVAEPDANISLLTEADFELY